MKIRNGFVSNSSSSSFAISIKDENDTKVKVEYDLKSLQDHTIIKNIEELNDYFMKHYGLDIKEIDKEGWEFEKKRYYSFKNQISSGRIIFIGEISSDDEIKPIIDEKLLKTNFNLIDSDNL